MHDIAFHSQHLLYSLVQRSRKRSSPHVFCHIWAMVLVLGLFSSNGSLHVPMVARAEPGNSIGIKQEFNYTR